MHRHILIAAAAALAAAPAAAQSRHANLTKRFAQTPDQAKVLSAGYLGGSGTEWLAGGGFQPDGAVVLVGVSLGPSLELAGTPAVVLGRDAAAPAAPERKPKLGKAGKPETDKAGNPKYEDFGWRHENATAFVARLSPDMKRVLSLARFPWKAGGATAAVVDAEGGIYLAGPATDGIAALGGDVQALPVADTETKKAAVNHTHLTKIDASGTKVLWGRHFRGPSNAPDVELDKAGKVKFTGADMRTFDRTGRQESVVVVPGGLSGRSAVNPLDGTFARGGEHHWATGREPWRCPILNIHKPDGKLLYQLYDWGGPYVGLDNIRLVSDSAVRIVKYDDEGNLIIYAWSDGGNSVMYREPNDVRTTSKKMGGLGMSAWGAGVLSCAYLIKIETKNYTVSGGTLWLAFLNDKDKPNSIWIDALGFAGDGSVCFAGRSAWGLIRTGNAIGGGEPAGPYVAVLNKDCTSLRFCSDVPAAGKSDVNDGDRFRIVRGKVDGKDRVLFLSGAVEQEENYGKTLPAPTVNGPQPKFAGGHLDGHFVLLDLSAGK